MALDELGIVCALVERVIQLFELLSNVDGPCHGSNHIRACNGPLVFHEAFPGSTEQDGNKIVHENTRFREKSGDGTIVVGVIFAPEFLEVTETASDLVSHSVYAILESADGFDHASYEWPESFTSVFPS